MKIEDAEHLVQFFTEHDIDFYLESNGCLFASKHCKKRIGTMIQNFLIEKPEDKLEIEIGLQPFHDCLIEGEDLVREDINKISFLGSSLSFERKNQEFAS